MMVDPAHSAGSHTHEGTTFHFCSTRCLQRFRANPERYLHPQAVPEVMPESMPGAEYTCPMHPAIVQVGPGSCPLCGMALEPKAFSLDTLDAPDPESIDMEKRFRVSLLFSVPLVVLSMAGLLPAWMQLILATPVVLWCALPVWHRALASVIHRSPNMFTLIGIGVAAAYLYSI